MFDENEQNMKNISRGKWGEPEGNFTSIDSRATSIFLWSAVEGKISDEKSVHNFNCRMRNDEINFLKTI